MWLLTEIHIDAAIAGMHAHRTAELMGPAKSWAAIFSTGAGIAQSDPHRATALADVDGVGFMSSVLPWRACGPSWPGLTLAEKMKKTLDALRAQITETTVWGGDWNQAFEGSDFVGTRDGREQILDLIHANGLSLPTRSLGGATPRHRSIDHIAVPIGWDVQGVHRISAAENGRRLSDHDAYVVSIEC